MKKCVNGYITERIAYWYDVDNELRRATHTYGTREYNVNYTYDNDGNLITEKGSTGSYNVNKTYQYTVENRLQAVYEGNDLLLALAYDGDGNKVFQMSYDPFTNATGKTGINTPNVKERSQTETDLRLMIKTSGKINSYSLVEYITDVNTGYLGGIDYPGVLMELNMNGETDIVYVYGNEFFLSLLTMAYPTPKQVTHKAITPIKPSIVNIRIAPFHSISAQRRIMLKRVTAPLKRANRHRLGSTKINYNIAEHAISRLIWRTSGQTCNYLGMVIK